MKAQSKHKPLVYEVLIIQEQYIGCILKKKQMMKMKHYMNMTK